MNILSVHNSYKQAGGEDEVFRQEANLLERYGHRVIRHQAHNDAISELGPVDLLGKTIFNKAAYKEIRALLRQHNPCIVHVHNTFPLLSPSVYYAAAHERLPVVQTLHNYRWLCPAGVLFRSGRICEDCPKNGSFWPVVQHKCYRQSRAASAVAASTLTIHRYLRTLEKHVTTYVAPSNFVHRKFVQSGFPVAKLAIKPNFVDPDPGQSDYKNADRYCVYVGRLAPEKGIRTLLDAWQKFSPPVNLEIVGDGELAEEVSAAAEKCQRIKWNGRMPQKEALNRIRNATALIMPSIWYEPFGMVVIEAFALGIPVVASKLGALETIVQHGRTGLHFEAGDAGQLAEQVTSLLSDCKMLPQMRAQARLEFERLYTGEKNYELLMQIYKQAIARFDPTSTQIDEMFESKEDANTLARLAG